MSVIQAVMDSSEKLSQPEKNLLWLAFKNAQSKNPNTDWSSEVKVSASDYANMFNVDLDISYLILRDSIEILFGRDFSYRSIDANSGYEAVAISRWISSMMVSQDDYMVSFRLTHDIRSMFSALQEKLLKQVVIN